MCRKNGFSCLIVLALAFSLCGCQSEEQKEEDAQIELDNKICAQGVAEAHKAAQGFVEKSVGAKSVYGDMMWLVQAKVQKLDECEFAVESRLETENKDGLDVHTDYRAVVRYEGEGQWQLVELKKGPNKIISDE